MRISSWSATPGNRNGMISPPLREFNLLVSGSPWPMKRAVAPGGKSLIFHGGVGPGWGSSGDGELGSWSVCGPHLESVFSDGKGGAGEGKETPLVSGAREVAGAGGPQRERRGF